jgi:hypothetical protein
MSRLGGPGGGASFSGERRPASAPLASGGSNVRSVKKRSRVTEPAAICWACQECWPPGTRKHFFFRRFLHVFGVSVPPMRTDDHGL